MSHARRSVVYGREWDEEVRGRGRGKEGEALTGKHVRLEGGVFLPERRVQHQLLATFAQLVDARNMLAFRIAAVFIPVPPLDGQEAVLRIAGVAEEPIRRLLLLDLFVAVVSLLIVV